MRIQECPHCHVSVLLRADGTCPSCGANANGPADVPTTETIVTVYETDRMPDLCCRCAQPTQRRVAVRAKRQLDGESPVLSWLLLLVNWIAALLRMGGESRMQVRMPLCDACHGGPKLKPRDIRFEDFSLKFVVHREFRARLEQLRSRGVSG